MEESSRRYLGGRGPWPSGQWASHSLSSRQGCQLGQKLAQEGLDEVMGADSGDGWKDPGILEPPGPFIRGRPSGVAAPLQGSGASHPEPVGCDGDGASVMEEPG